MSQRDVDRFYLNSDGAMRAESHSLASVFLYSKTEEEGRKPRSAGAFRISYGVNDLDIDGCIKETAEKTISHLNYQKIPTGNIWLCFLQMLF